MAYFITPNVTADNSAFPLRQAEGKVLFPVARGGGAEKRDDGFRIVAVGAAVGQP